MKALKIILIITLSLAFMGCGILWQRYNSQEYGFSIFLPRLWYKEEGRYATVIMARSSQRGPKDRYLENINVVASYAPQGMSLTTYFEINKNDIFEKMPGEEFDVKQGEVFAGGTPGIWLSFSTKTKVITLRVLSAVWIKGDRAYVVTCSADDAQFPEYEPIFKKAIQSIRFK